MKTPKGKIAFLLLILTSLPFTENVNAQSSVNKTDIPEAKKVIYQRQEDSLEIAATVSDSGKTKALNRNFLVGLEFRPRIEYRNGYKQLPNDTTQPAYFGTQRSRLSFTYLQPKFKFHTSIQDIRVWGQYGQVSSTGSLNVFEAYAESYFTDNLFMRMGRQKIELDNGRLFSAANWSQPGRAHDGINLIFKTNNINSELMTFFNQTAERISETTYSPTTFTNYKSLSVHYLQAKLRNHITFTTINAVDGYQSSKSSQTLYVRGTSGGRLEFENIYATISGYYQYGQLQSSQEISAYYLQPEIQIKANKLTTRLGAEYLSGDDATKESTLSKSFVPLYGVAWKFMGNMDYFTAFPNDLKNGGLINPYLFIIYEINKKLTVRADGHLFYLQNKVLDKDNRKINPYLGVENDFSLKYKVNDFTIIDFGFSYMFAEKSMETLKGGNSNRIPIWSYVMITYKPELLNRKT